MLRVCFFTVFFLRLLWFLFDVDNWSRLVSRFGFSSKRAKLNFEGNLVLSSNS